MTFALRAEPYPRDDYVQALQMMLNRMAVSEHKYGPIEDNYPAEHSALDNLVERVRLYEETGNTEWLLDAANFAVIEFLRPSHEAPHFRSTDSDESPGLR